MSDRPDPSSELDRLAQEFTERARRGEAPSIASYAAAHPALAVQIQELFPVLAIVEGLKGERRSDAEAVPTAIGPYAIVRELGRGGMGRVYEARSAGGHRVAVKVVHPHLLDEPEYIARFLREAEAGRRVDHPSVVRTLETGLVDTKTGEVPYIVLEYVEGRNLRALLEEVDLVPERLCRHIGAALAEALEAVHGAGLVHRDVKPDNVVITAEETVKLMDLGVAVLQDRARRLSQTGAFVGSLLYAHPKQILGEAPDPAWDLHALGILLYELATGRHPARDPESSRSPRRLNPRLSPFFDRLVQALLAAGEGQGLDTATTARCVLQEGESSSWWRHERARLREAGRLEDGAWHASRFVGRAVEVERLDRVFADACHGQGQVVLLAGEAGIGKTRLVYEWVDRLAGRPGGPHRIIVRHEPGHASGDDGNMATALLDVLGTTGLEERLRALLGSRARLAGPLARLLRGEALGGASLPSGAGLDAAYAGILARVAQERPLVLVAEDLHFASEDAQQRFLLFAEALRERPVLLLGTLRPIPTPVWTAELDARARVTRLDLGGLDTNACHDLLAETSVSCKQLESQVPALLQRADRNPYFLLEFARECLRRQEAGFTGIRSDTEIPASVRGLLTARLASLDASDRELLEVAACYGNPFDPLAVAEAAGIGRIAALKQLGRLERRHGLLHTAGRDYRFQHHLLQELLHEELHPALKESYHAALGDVLARDADPDDGRRAVELSLHFLDGGVPGRAQPFLRRAMEHLEWEYFLYERSFALAQKAFEHADALGPRERAFALYVIGHRHVLEGAFEKAAALLDQALGVAKQTGDAELEVDLHIAVGWMHSRRRALEPMRAAYLAAAACARSAGLHAQEGVAYAHLCTGLLGISDSEEAEAMGRRGLDALTRLEETDAFAEGRCRSNLAQAVLRCGRKDEARALLEQAQALSHSVADLPTEVGSLNTLGEIAFLECRYQEAHDYVERALALCRQLGVAHTDVEKLANIAACRLELGQLEEALAATEEAVALAPSTAPGWPCHYARLRRGQVLAALGRWDAALEDLEAAHAAALETGRSHLGITTAASLVPVYAFLGRVDEARALLDAIPVGDDVPPRRRTVHVAAKAKLLEHEGRFDEAYAKLLHARALLEEAGMDPERHELALGRLKARAGERDAALAHLETALAWARARGVIRMQVLAEAWRARLGAGDALAARVSYETHEASLPADARHEAREVLGLA